MNRAERLRKRKAENGEKAPRKPRKLNQEDQLHAVRLAHEAAIVYYKQELERITEAIARKKKEHDLLFI